VVPRLTVGLETAVGAAWRDTRIALPETEATDLLRPRKIQIGETSAATLLLDTLPLAILYASVR
jgi:maltooligosyltrehalose synthase